MRSDNTYVLDKYLYGKIIKAKFIADMIEHTITWRVYDCTNQQQYYAFYYNVNGDNNRVALKTIDEFVALIDAMIRENIIVTDKTDKGDKKFDTK